jgi:hypothetical protein
LDADQIRHCHYIFWIFSILNVFPNQKPVFVSSKHGGHSFEIKTLSAAASFTIGNEIADETDSAIEKIRPCSLGCAPYVGGYRDAHTGVFFQNVHINSLTEKK